MDLYTDKEGAVLSRAFADMIKRHDVRLKFALRPPVKAALIEVGVHARACAFTQSSYVLFQSFIRQVYTRKPDLQKALHQIVKTHNSTSLNSLAGMTPTQVFTNPDNEFRLFNIRFPQMAYGGTPARASIDVKLPKIGSFVRILDKRGKFDKEVTPHSHRYSTAVYQARRD